ncbi:Sodium/calcium exchanger protein-domain-containing protein [Cenococcum geophilum]
MLFLGTIKNRAYNGIFRSSNTLKSLSNNKRPNKEAALKRNIPAKDQINILLLAIPIGFMVNYLYVNGITIFIVNFIAIIPLTVMLSYATKEIALRAGNILGGTNAIKLIISILALTKGQITIVKTFLIGSMLLNLLLILSIYFFFRVVNTTASLLALSVGSLIILTAFHSILLTMSLNSSTLNRELSYGTAIILLIIYLYTKMCNALSQRAPKRKSSQVKQDLNAEKEDDEIKFSTALVAFCSEFIVNSISNITASGTISTTFIGLILLLIIRNAAEYIIAVIVACKDKISLVINITIGSNIQIALLVLPFIIILSWTIGQNCITLLFDTFLIAILFVAMLLVNYLIQDSKSNWLKGVLIMAIYAIIAVAGWFYPKQVLDPLCPT